MSQQAPGKGAGRIFMILAWCAGLYLATQFFGRWEQRQIGKVLLLSLGLELRRWLFKAAFAHQYAAVFAVPHTLFFANSQQATALTLGRQPYLIALRVDGNTLEQRIEMQQHAAGTGLTHQRRVDFEP